MERGRGEDRYSASAALFNPEDAFGSGGVDFEGSAVIGARYPDAEGDGRYGVGSSLTACSSEVALDGGAASDEVRAFCFDTESGRGGRSGVCDVLGRGGALD